MNDIYLTHVRIENPDDFTSLENQPVVQACVSEMALVTTTEVPTENDTVAKKTEVFLDPGDPSHIVNTITALSAVLLQHENANVRVYGSLVQEGVRRAHEVSLASQDEGVQEARRSFLSGITMPETNREGGT